MLSSNSREGLKYRIKKKELGKKLSQLFTKNIAFWEINRKFSLPGDLRIKRPQYLDCAKVA